MDDLVNQANSKWGQMESHPSFIPRSETLSNITTKKADQTHFHCTHHSSLQHGGVAVLMISTMSGNVPLSLWRTSTLIDLEQMQSNLHGDLVVRCSLRETNLRTQILIRRGLRPIQSLHFGILVMFHVLIIFGNHLATWAWARKSLLDFDFDFMVIVYILLELGRITAQTREMTQNHTF